VLVTVVGGTYAWIEGFDKGLQAAGADLKTLGKKVSALEARTEATDEALGETHAQLIGAEERIADVLKREQLAKQTAADEAEADKKAEYEYWRAIVMSNAPKGRSDSYARTYKANYEDGHRAMAAAHMTLGWGTAGR
jgi:hypothetical protein